MLFGGVSAEHEVSIVTALQVMNALVEANYKVLPLYVSKEGMWILGDHRMLNPVSYRNLAEVKKLGKRVLLPADSQIGLLTRGLFGYGGMMEQVDVVFPVFHGRNGEDGTIQGLIELANLPYVGCGTAASAIGMDKYLAKRIAKDLGITVVQDVLVTRNDWEKGRKNILNKIKENLGSDVFVKPNDLGSSIGINRAKNLEELENALEVAFVYSNRILVEKTLNRKMELNISIIGNDPYEVSAIEQPISESEVLSFQDKYISSEGKTKGMAGAKRLVPAPISEKLKSEVAQSATRFFGAIGGKGISRVDFMLDIKGKLYFNEINTIPGSLAFYLWKASKVSFNELVSRLVILAEEEWRSKNTLVSVFESNILEKFASGSVKGKA